MRYLEVRRHTMRLKPGQHLSQAGVTLARRVGETMGPFERVLTSTIPRAYETAIAMGFAVDEQLEGLGLMSDEVSADFDWDSGFAAIATAVRRGGPAADYARKQADFWHSVTRSLSDGAAALMVTHGGIIELGVAVCIPDADFDALGGSCSQSEGVRLTFDTGRFIDVEVLRVG